MGLIILGIIVLLVGIFSKNQRSPISSFRGLIMAAGVIIVGVGIAVAAIRQVEAGSVGVQKLFGKVQHEILYPGLNFVNPLVDVAYFDIKTLNYTMASSMGEGQVRDDDAIQVLSEDGLQVSIDLTVLYKLIPSRAPMVLDSIGTDFEIKVVRPQIRAKIREIAVNFAAVELYSPLKREQFELSIKRGIDEGFLRRGFVLEDLLIRKINLPASVRESIERKLTAEQEAQRMEFVLQKEQQEAERKRVEARGIADAQNIINAELSSKIIQWEQIKVQKELVSSPNSKVIILGDKSAPFILDTK